MSNYVEGKFWAAKMMLSALFTEMGNWKVKRADNVLFLKLFSFCGLSIKLRREIDSGDYLCLIL